MNKNATILIVEDEHTIRHHLVDLFGKNGFICLEAEGVEVAARKMQHNSVDLIISDYDLVDGKALELLQKITDAGMEQIPVLIMSAAPVNVLKALNKFKQVKNILHKPVEADRILTAVAEELKSLSGNGKKIYRRMIGDDERRILLS